MKVLVIADDDAFSKATANDSADILVSCGDMADQVILQTAHKALCARILAVKGNHDSAAPFPAPVFDLHLKKELCNGLVFGGFRGSWRYKPRGHFLYDQDEVERLLVAFPPVDVFVAHNSPRHIHDRDDEVHFGFDAFVSYIRRAQPRFFFHGHQHINQETLVGNTRVIGVFGQQRFDVK
jgi:Icc-related predicted phosphoesterase